MSTAPELLPWHDDIWRRLGGYLRQERLPHATLLCGPRGVGKTIVARAFSQALLCAHPNDHGTACGVCPACHLFRAGTHPDFLWIQPAAEQSDPHEEAAEDAVQGTRKKGSRYIVVDQIRALGEWLTLKSHAGGRKVALIAPADRMNVNAANSLLKSLEEPPAATLLILATANPNHLPATVRSRCHLVPLPAVPLEKALPWFRSRGLDNQGQIALLLNLAAGGPLVAWELTQTLEQRRDRFTEWEEVILRRKTPVAVAQSWSAYEADQLITFQWSWSADMIKLALAPQSMLVNIDLVPRLNILIPRLGISRIYQQMERLNQALRLVRGPTNPNLQLLWEDLLIPWRA